GSGTRYPGTGKIRSMKTLRNKDSPVARCRRASFQNEARARPRLRNSAKIRRPADRISRPGTFCPASRAQFPWPGIPRKNGRILKERENYWEEEIWGRGYGLLP